MTKTLVEKDPGKQKRVALEPVSDKDQWKGLKVCIVAYGAGREDAPFKDDTFAMWSINEVGTVLPDARWDCNFQTHPLNVIKDVYPDHLDFLKTVKYPTYGIVPFMEENILPFPFLEMCHELESIYFTNTVAQVVGYAIYCKVKEIHLFGVSMNADEEYLYQRPCLEYWIGVARGMGIKVVLPEGCTLLQNGFIYGLEMPPAAEGVVTEGWLKRQINDAAEGQAEAMGQMNYRQGELDALNRMSKKVVCWKRDNRKEVSTGQWREGASDEEVIAQQFRAELKKLGEGNGSGHPSPSK